MSANAQPTLKPVTAAISRHYGWTALALMPGIALAGPVGEQVQQGVVAVTRPDANTTTVTQGSNSAIVNWHSFSVDGQEYVQFVQPGANAAILNRVTGGNASQILGRIDANGRVFLVNPQGVYFGAGSRVETAGFAASTLDINDDDFMQGRYVFAKGTGAPDATVSNSGEIVADQFVVLMGDRVANEGLVQARLGTVALAAGARVSLQLDTSGLVSFAVDEATAAAHAGVENTGDIIASGGRVLMTAKVANDLVATAVNNAGAVRAVGVAEEGGQIFLRGAGGAVVNSGTLDASGPTGGSVVVHATNDDVDIAAGAVVRATGAGTGDGGEVRLVAGETLNVEAGAVIDARGGSGGAGGLIEVSAHQGLLKLDGDIKAGDGGEVIVDPARLAIGADAAAPGGDSTLATVGKGFIESQLNANTDVTLVASDEIFAVGGPFTISASGTGDLALRIGSMLSTGSGAFTGGGSYGGDCGSLGVCDEVGVPNGFFNFASDTSGDINLTGISINILGDFKASAGSATGNVTLGAINAASVIINGANTSLATGNVVTGAIAAAGGLVQLEAGTTTGNVSTGPVTARDLRVNTLGGQIATGNVNIVSATVVDSVQINAGATLGNINIGAITVAATSHSASLALAANNGNVAVGGPVSVSATPSSANADVDINARAITVNGNVTVAAGTNGSADLNFSASSGITVNGNLVVSGGGDSAEIDIDNATSGNININGSVVATGGSSASIDINNFGGNININGSLAATGSSAFIGIDADGRINLNGGATATATGNGDRASVFLTSRSGMLVTGALTAVADDDANIFVANAAYGSGSGDLVLRGPVSARSTTGQAFVEIDNVHGGVSLAALVSAQGIANLQNPSRVNITAGAGGISTLDSGLIAAPSIKLTSVANGPISVRTQSPDISLSNDGDASPDVALDNRAHSGLTTLKTGTFISSYGSYGSFQNSATPLFSADDFSVGGGFGAVKLAFTGDTVVASDFAARNALIQVDNGTLEFRGSVLIGERNLPNSEGDILSLLTLARAVRSDGSRIPLPRFNGVPTTGPNAVFRARNGIDFEYGLGFVDPDTPYVVFQTDGTLDLGPGVYSESSIGNEFLAQFTAFTPTRAIRVENETPLIPFTDGPLFTNLDHFSKLPGTTMIIGGAPGTAGVHRGPIIIGQNGPIDIGGQNILFSTRGTIRGAQNVLSTGFVGDTGSLQSALTRVFQTPIVNEFDEVTEDDQDDDQQTVVDVDDSSGSGDDKLVAQKSNDGQMCQ